MSQEKKVAFKNLIAYGLGDIYGGGSFLVISLLFIYFLTTYMKIPPLYAGLIFGIGKAWDAVTDPLMGYISDRTRTRFGRRRVFFLLGILPIAVTFILIWVPLTVDSTALKVIYYALAFVLFSTVFTMVMVPYSALNAEMSHDYKIRTRLSGFRIFFSQFSALIAATVPQMIINSYKANGSAEKGHLVMAVIFGIFYALPWFFVFLGTWELPAGQIGDKKSLREIVRNYASLLHNRTFKIHILMYIFAYTAMDFLMFLFKYYLKWNLGRDGQLTVTMGPLMGAQIVMLAIYVIISNKKGKGFAYRTGLTIWAIAMVLSFFLHKDLPLPLIMANCALIGMGLSAGVMIPWAILPSVVDVDEIITTEKRAGTYAGAMTFLRKIANAIAAPLAGLMLQLIGYNIESETQTAGTLLGLRVSFFAVPLVFIIIGIIISFKFTVTPHTHALLKKELERLRAGGSKDDVDTETRAAVESLTGLPYAEIYDKGGKVQ